MELGYIKETSGIIARAFCFYARHWTINIYFSSVSRFLFFFNFLFLYLVYQLILGHSLVDGWVTELLGIIREVATE